MAIWGDDIGWSNLGCYNHAVMGYKTPNIDSIAKEGVLFTDHLGDRNEHLPTAHGFDEFFGNLSHLNTQEEAEQRDYQNFGSEFAAALRRMRLSSERAVVSTLLPPMSMIQPYNSVSESSESSVSKRPAH